MTVDQLRSLHQARPFQTFDILLADQRVFHIPHPELLAVIPPGRSIIVGHADGSFDVVDLLLVTSPKAGNGAPRRRKRS